MKFVAACLLALSVIGFVDIVNELRLGKISVERGSHRKSETLIKGGDPERFSGALGYKVLRATLAFGFGIAVMAFIRKQERTDPLSPKFTGRQSLGELSTALDDKQSNATKT